MRTKLVYVGRGAVNLVVFVLLVVFGLQNLISARVAISIALVGLYLAGVCWIEGREPSELLSRTGPAEFAAGFALGLGLFTTLMLLLWMFGAYRPSGLESVVPLPGGFLSCVQPAIFEEIVFRGFLFRLSAKLLGTWVAGTLRGRDLLTGGAFGPEASIIAVMICLGAALFLLSRAVRRGRLEPPVWVG